MEPTSINTRTARDYWKLVTKDDDATDDAQTDTPNDDLYEEEEWEKEYMSRPMKPYTMEEIYDMLAQSERDFAEGRYRDVFEAIAQLREKYAHRNALAAEMGMNQELAEAV